MRPLPFLLFALILLGTPLHYVAAQVRPPIPIVVPRIPKVPERLPSRTPARPTVQKEVPKMEWQKAANLVVVELRKAQAGPVGRSMPPLYTFKLSLRVEEALRGGLEKGLVLETNYSVRQRNAPVFKQEGKYLVALSNVRGAWRVNRIEPATENLIAQVRTLANLPVGWKMTQKGEAVSPWASIKDWKWPQVVKDAKLVCSITGRPALDVPAGLTFAVAKVPPKKDIKWRNPDGDGLYEMTLTNTTDKEITCPALLESGGKALWNECLLIECQGKGYPIPGCGTIPADAKPVKVSAGKSLTTQVNALTLDGPTWPRGGYRIEFTFGLGCRSATKSFYYYSKHHDPIRQATQK